MRWFQRGPSALGALLGLAAAGGVILARRSERDPGPGPDGLRFPVDERLYPFTHRFVTLPGGARVHYLDEGPATPRRTIVFLHGNPTWSLLYRYVVQALRADLRCVALDYPGFGLSEAPAGYDFLPRTHSRAVEAFFDALGLSSVTLMVHDWGGPIGLGLAGRRPELVSSLVIGNSWAWPRLDAGARWFSAVVGGPAGRFLGLRFNAIPALFFALGARDRLPEEVLEHYRRPFVRPERREPTVIFPREIVASSAYLAEVEQGLARIADRPTLIVWGEQDRAFPADQRARFERAFPDHRTVLLPTAKHFIQEDEPARVAAAIRGFLAGVDQARGAGAHP